MRLLNTGRMMGKTTEAIKVAHKTGAYIIVPTRADALRVMGMAEGMALNIRFPITIDEYLRYGMDGSFVRNIVIDDLDRIIDRIFSGLTIEIATITSGPVATSFD